PAVPRRIPPSQKPMVVRDNRELRTALCCSLVPRGLGEEERFRRSGARSGSQSQVPIFSSEKLVSRSANGTGSVIAKSLPGPRPVDPVAGGLGSSGAETRFASPVNPLQNKSGPAQESAKNSRQEGRSRGKSLDETSVGAPVWHSHAPPLTTGPVGYCSK